MKFSVAQKDLNLTIKALTKTLSRKPHLPVLAGIFIQAKDSFLELTSTDLISGTKIKIPAQIDEAGEIVVNGKVFLETVSFFDQEITSFELREKDTLLINGHDKVFVPNLNQEYPDFSLIDQQPQQTTLDFWTTITKKVAFAASSDQTRPALTGVLLRGEGEFLQSVCTDGFRLAILDQQLKSNFFHQRNFLLSAKAINDLVSLLQIFNQEEISFSYDEVGGQIFFFNQQIIYFTKLINSNYPPFEKIVPLEFTTQIELDRQDLIKNLNKASVFARTANNVVKLEIKKDRLLFTVNSLGEGSFESEQDLISIQGENLKIAFNIRYFLDFLNLSSDDLIKIGFNGADKPALIKTSQDANWQYIVMPFKPKG